MKVKLEFECGERTCAIEPGHFCKFLEASSYGTKWQCGLFDERLFDIDGWLMRCPKCMAEVKKIYYEDDGL